MGYTPVELRHVKVPRRLLGYHRAAVEEVLEEVADSFETVWSDRGELADKVELLDKQVEELKHREQMLTNTLVAAERAADEMRERAKREAEVILSEAHGEARSVLRSVQGERERLFAEVRRIEALLRAALGVVEEAGGAAASTVASAPDQPGDQSNEQPREEQPSHGETREFPAPVATPQAQPARPELAPAGDPADDVPEPAAEDESPGWPPLRKVAQGRRDFDWGD